MAPRGFFGTVCCHLQKEIALAFLSNLSLIYKNKSEHHEKDSDRIRVKF